MAVKNVIFRLETDNKDLKAGLQDAQRDVQNLDKETKKTTKEMNTLGSAIKKAGVLLAGVFAVNKLIDFGNATIKVASDFEALNVSFATFLGNEEKAVAILEELEKFSLKTPFTPEEVNNAGKSLLAFGITAENLTNTLKRVGDLSAGTGKNFNELAVIFGKAKVQGTLFAEDINQLTEAGIPIIDEFARILGKDTSQIKKLGSEGKITFDLLDQAFTELTSSGGRFFGLTEKLSQTTTGRISTLTGEFNKLQREIGQYLLPAFNETLNIGFEIITWIRELPTFLETNRKTIIGLSTAFITYTSAVLISSTSTKAWMVVQKLWNTISIASARQMRILTLGTKQMTLAQRTATIGTRAFALSIRGLTNAIRSNPIGLLVTAVTTLSILFADMLWPIEEVNEEMEDNAKFTWDSVEANKEMTKLIGKETNAMEGLFAELKNSNTSRERKLELIKTINEKYGEYIPNLLTEESTLKQIQIAYENVRKSMLRKLAVQTQEEKIMLVLAGQITEAEKMTKAIEKQLGFYKMQGLEAGKVAEIMTKLTEAGVEIRNETEDMVTNTKLWTKEGNAMQKIMQVLDKDQQSVLDKLLQYGIVAGSINKTQRDYQKIVDKNKTTISEIIEFYSQWGDDVDVITDKVILNEKGVQSLFNTLLKELLRLQKISKELDIKFGDLDDIEKIEKIRDAEIQSIRDVMEERIRVAKEKKVYDDNNKALLKKILDEQIKIVTTKADEEIRKVRMKKMETLVAIGEVERQQELVLVEQKIKEQEELISDLRKEGREKQAQEQESELINMLDYEKSIKVASIMDEYNIELALAKNQGEKMALIEEQKNLKLLKLDTSYADKKKDITKSTADAEKEQRKDAIEDIVRQTTQMVKELLSLAIEEVNGQIDAQKTRIERAKELAELGNAEQLQVEEERLDALNKKKAQFVQTQQALDLVMIISQSMLAIAKAGAEGGALAPFTIASTLIALAIGIASAKAQAQSVAGGFAEGGYTGDGAKHDVAGVVHKGEYVFSKEKTSKHRRLFDALHTGRDINPDLLSQKMILVENTSMNGRLEKIERAINKQSRMNLSIDEKGIHGIVSNLSYKSARLKNRQSK